MSEDVKRIGMFGGSFDPPHIGHIFCARIAAEQLRLDRLLVVPTALQPHKPEGA
ncbi:MAG TPA: nicotinate-nucleotide adenylyltransferase, partial [Bacteroidetes bacterium]|nr:nicotinate-nucleotide adenylyltransferase [Bacteroidota bacterium]